MDIYMDRAGVGRAVNIDFFVSLQRDGVRAKQTISLIILFVFFFLT